MMVTSYKQPKTRKISEKMYGNAGVTRAITYSGYGNVIH